MNLKNSFEWAMGTVLGRSHAQTGRNNQDAWFLRQSEKACVAIVADGCGSCEKSEVGSQLGARLVGENIFRQLTRRHWFAKDRALEEILEQARQDILAELRTLSNLMGDDVANVALDYFLFTIVGALVTEKVTALFALGDGLVALNGQVRQLGPFPGNAPPYLAYGLMPAERLSIQFESLRFQLTEMSATEQVQNLLIGTDGVADFQALVGEQFPGQERVIGPLEEFWTEDRYFKNPDMVRRTLHLAGREVVLANAESGQVERRSGHLPDDTTLIVMRRRQSEKKGGLTS